MFSFLLSYKPAGSRAAFGARYRGRFIYMDVSMGLSL